VSQFARMTARQVGQGVAAQEFSASEVVRDALARIARTDPQLNSCSEVFEQQALSAADLIDRKVAQGRDSGPLAGVPVVVKSLFDLAGSVTVAGAKQRLEAAPAREDATAVRRLREAGAVIVAATNMDEFAYGFATDNEYFGATRNPHDPSRLAGGSSGGAAAAVAADFAHIGLGSDTNGSIRVPAAFCGVFGLKPTFGRLSRAGTVAFVSSLDHVGPMARSVDDLAISYDLMQGPDPRDPVCTALPPDPVSALADSAAGLRIGVLGGWFERNADEQARAAVSDVAQELGATARVELPGADIARFAAFLITSAEAGNLHLHRLRNRAADFDKATRDRMLAGALLPANIVIQAQRFRRRFRDAARAVFADYDVLIAPTTPCAAPAYDQQVLMIDGKPASARAHVGIYTQPLSYIGLPVMTVPVVTTGPLPIGVQLIAAPWAEARIFRVAAALEAAGLVRAPIPAAITALAPASAAATA
jgi:AtzE family amidohydrolase